MPSYPDIWPTPQDGETRQFVIGTSGGDRFASCQITNMADGAVYVRENPAMPLDAESAQWIVPAFSTLVFDLPGLPNGVNMLFDLTGDARPFDNVQTILFTEAQPASAYISAPAAIPTALVVDTYDDLPNPTNDGRMGLVRDGFIFYVFDEVSAGWKPVGPASNPSADAEPPQDGQLQWRNNALQVWDGSSWENVFPAIDPSYPKQTYTPSWISSGTAPSIGNGTIGGSYRQVDKLIFLSVSLTMGSTTTFGTGSYTFTIPSGFSINGQWAGQWFAFDAGVGFFYGGQINAANTTSIQPLIFSPTVAAQFSGGITNTTPITWGNGDVLDLRYIFSIP